MVFIIIEKKSIHSPHFVSMDSFKYPSTPRKSGSIRITEMTQYPNTPSIVDLARIPLVGVIEVLAYQIDDCQTFSLPNSCKK